MVRMIVVTPHDPAWRDRYLEEARALRAIWGEWIVRVHHIGSTSVPGLAAKPIVDLLVEVRDIAALDPLDADMRARGYIPRGEYGIPGRRYYIKGTVEQRTHHIHAYQQGHPRIRDHLAFRDYLVAHPEEAAAYGALKARLAASHPYDIDAYVSGKDACVGALVGRALAWQERENACHGAPDCV